MIEPCTCPSASFHDDPWGHQEKCPRYAPRPDDSTSRLPNPRGSAPSPKSPCELRSRGYHTHGCTGECACRCGAWEDEHPWEGENGSGCREFAPEPARSPGVQPDQGRRPNEPKVQTTGEDHMNENSYPNEGAANDPRPLEPSPVLDLEAERDRWVERFEIAEADYDQQRQANARLTSRLEEEQLETARLTKGLGLLTEKARAVLALQYLVPGDEDAHPDYDNDPGVQFHRACRALAAILDAKRQPDTRRRLTATEGVVNLEEEK